MASQRIVLCYPVEPQHCRRLAEVAPDAEIVDAGQQRIADELPEADIFIGHAKVPVPWPQVVRRGRLRWIQSSAAGLDHCLTPEVIAAEQIQVTSASGVFADPVAEQTLALLLGILRGLPTFFRAQQEREFVRRPTRDLHDATIGIVGFGGNGRRIAEVLAPFRAKLYATDMFPGRCPPHVSAVWPADRLDDLLRISDIVILCLPLNAQTLGMFSAERFARMRPGAVLINVARGPLVVERDLVAALQSGHLSAAGLDVTEVEPLPQSSPLWDMPNVLITPHVGAQSARRIDVTTALAAENLRRYLSGAPLLNLVDKQLGFPVPPDERNS
jgi:phosphoglycerate dehydrogenase-like enzyme